VYSTFSTFENVTTELTLNSRLPFNRSQDPHRNLLFLATSPISTSQVLIKLIVGDRYGTEAHKILAKAEFAPALYGTAKVQGAPTAYVMEYLSPNDGWKTLHEHARQHGDVKSHILAPLRLIFAEMEKHDIVHGDFRPNNIMIRRKGAGDDYELRIIDFDWAGENGKVNYPWCRNEDISWPGQPNDPIVIPHDRKLLGSYLGPKGDDSWLGTSDLEGIPEGLTGSPA
jgi:serine/threonine protein kinase